MGESCNGPDVIRLVKLHTRNERLSKGCLQKVIALTTISSTQPSKNRILAINNYYRLIRIINGYIDYFYIVICTGDLPDNVVSAPSVKSFEKRLDQPIYTLIICLSVP